MISYPIPIKDLFLECSSYFSQQQNSEHEGLDSSKDNQLLKIELIQEVEYNPSDKISDQIS